MSEPWINLVNEPIIPKLASPSASFKEPAYEPTFVTSVYRCNHANPEGRRLYSFSVILPRKQVRVSDD